MENRVAKDIFDSISYEVVERITRFILHLEDIQNQFYADRFNHLGEHNLINEYRNALLKLLEMSIICYQANNTLFVIDKKHFNVQKSILGAINTLHQEWLSILPRPSEPIELTRFKRVIFKQIVLLGDKQERKNDDIIVSVNESVGEEITLDHPLTPYIENVLSKIKETILSLYDKDIALKENTTPLHNITIPRIDAANPFRWPSLIHEMSHYLMNDVVFRGKDIINDFYGVLQEEGKNNVLKFVCDYFNNREKSSAKESKLVFDDMFGAQVLAHWLTECWCDLFACILIGPSLYFSQYSAFINTSHNTYEIHPPASFRLLLIQTILSHRFAALYQQINPDYFNKCEQLIACLDYDKEMNWGSPHIKLTYIFSSFKNYFISHFFPPNDNHDIEINTENISNAEINEKLRGIVQKYVNLNPSVINFLKRQLKEGLPIPSIKTQNEKGEYEEIPTYVQEIFIASWITRFESLQGKIIEAISDEYSEDSTIESFFIKHLKNHIERHDQAVLKSIQVSEWFDLFIEEKKRPKDIVVWPIAKYDNLKYSNKGTLVDYEIEDLIYCNRLEIIPLINLREQIGTTSIDVRLGTCFQLFFPDEYGIVDFTNSEDDIFAKLSKKANFDFVEGITISPRQFLLGHSMEYIKLPDDVCANLEGRSSFARLGLEIHITAGFIDPGFEGVITFEIYNAGASAIKLYPGLRIGQLRLEKTNKPNRIYKDRHAVKYKGLLEHNVSRQNRDIEVSIIKKQLERQKSDK